MKILTIIIGVLVAAGIANPAGAGPFGQEMGFRLSVQDQGSRPDPQRGAQQSMPQRDMAQPAPQRDMRGTEANDRGRMSSDERRQLRRDIQDAGRDIYRAPRQGNGDQRHSRSR